MTQASVRAHIVIAAAVVAILIILIAVALNEVQASDERLVRHSDAPWTEHIRTLDHALAKKNVSAAERALHQAYLAALGGQRWEGMVEVGDATLRVGEVSGYRKVAEAKARQLYLQAFFRARQQRSIDGLLRTAEAFSALGDREVVEAGLRSAERVATQGRDPQSVARVRAFRERMADRSLVLTLPP